MKKMISSLLAAAVLCGTVVTSAFAAEPAQVANTITAKGYANEVHLTVGYDSQSMKLNAVSSGIKMHWGYYGNPYLVVSYYNADDTLRFQETVAGTANCNRLAEQINGTVVTPGDYIRVAHSEQSTRLAISGKVENVDADMSGSVKTVNIKDGYLYLGGSNLEFLTTLKSTALAELKNAVGEAKKIEQGNYRYDTWKALTDAIENAETVLAMSYATNTQISQAAQALSAAVSGLKENTVFHLKGAWDREALTFWLDRETMELKAEAGNFPVHAGFGDQEYFRVEIITGSGTKMISEGVSGVGTATAVANKLNKFYMMDGDSIYVYHKESTDRFTVTGPVVDAPHDLSTGMHGPTYGAYIHFKVVGNELVYKDTRWDSV